MADESKEQDQLTPPPSAGQYSREAVAAAGDPGLGSGSGYDRFLGALNDLAGGGMPGIHRALEGDYRQRLIELQTAQDSYSNYLRQMAEPNNPQTGKPWTPEEMQHLEQLKEKAKGDFVKLAGKSKAGKPIAAKLVEMGEGLIHRVRGIHGTRGDTPPPSGVERSGIQPPPSAQASTGPAATPPPGTVGDERIAHMQAMRPGTAVLPPPQQQPTGLQDKPIRLSAALRPPPGMAMGDAMASGAETSLSGEQMARQHAIADKDTEYRNRLKASIDPAYHENKLKQAIADIKEAEPGLSDEEARTKAEQAVGIVPKYTGKEMQPDFKDGMLVGVKDPATNAYYTDPATMPPAAKAIYDSAKKVEKEHEKETEDKEDRRFRRQLQLQASALQNALESSDYKSAKKVVTDAQKDYEAAIDRQATMHKNIVAAKKGDQQAMLSLVANHIGMTLGAQKGARITRAVWDEATASTPLLARLEAKFDSRGYLSGVTLAPEQMDSMVNLADEKVDILKQHVDRVNEDYAQDLGVKRSGLTKPPAAGGGGPKRIVVTKEDMANAGR